MFKSKEYFLVPPKQIIRHKHETYRYQWWAEIWAMKCFLVSLTLTSFKSMIYDPFQYTDRYIVLLTYIKDISKRYSPLVYKAHKKVLTRKLSGSKMASVSVGVDAWLLSLRNVSEMFVPSALRNVSANKGTSWLGWEGPKNSVKSGCCWFMIFDYLTTYSKLFTTFLLIYSSDFLFWDLGLHIK